MTAADVSTALQEKFPGVSARPSLDCPAFNIAPAGAPAVLRHLRDACDCDLLADVTAIDNGAEVSPRFTVVWHLYSTVRRGYVRVAADCANDDDPAAPSAADLWPGANWHERETYDMFGIKFDGHPDLRRILMWEGYPHFPLRKEFPLAGFETPLPAEDGDVAAETKVTLKPAPMMGGPFVAAQEPTMGDAEPRAKDESWTEHREKPE